MKRKRIFATTLAAAMLLSMAAPTAYAEESTDAGQETATETIIEQQVAEDGTTQTTVTEMQPDGSWVSYTADDVEGELPATTYAADGEGIKLETPTDLQWNRYFLGSGEGTEEEKTLVFMGCPSYR